MPNTLELATIPPRSNGKHPGGRPSKRTPEIVARIAEALSYGLTDQDAAAIVGISDETLLRWHKLQEFRGVIKGAIANRKLIRLQRIDSGCEGWQGTAWCMERQFPREWSRPEIQINQQINVHTDGVTDLDIPETELRRLTEIRLQIESEIGV